MDNYIEILEITKYNLSEAQFMASNFIDKNVMNRVFFNVLGAEAFISYLKKFGLINTNLFNIHSIKRVCEKVDIADVILDNIHIDVRVVFDENIIFIPKKHFYYGIVPDIYVVLKYDKNFQKINFLGYFEPSAINFSNANEDYYFLEPDKLQSPIDIMDFISNFSGVTEKSLSEEQMTRARELSISVSDHDVTDEEFKEFLGLLQKNKALRNTIAEYDNFETLAFNVARINKANVKNTMTNELVDMNDFINSGDDFSLQQDGQKEELSPTEDIGDVNGDNMLDEVQNPNSVGAVADVATDLSLIGGAVASQEAVDLAAVAGDVAQDAIQDLPIEDNIEMDSEDLSQGSEQESEIPSVDGSLEDVSSDVQDISDEIVENRDIFDSNTDITDEIVDDETLSDSEGASSFEMTETTFAPEEDLIPEENLSQDVEDVLDTSSDESDLGDLDLTDNVMDGFLSEMPEESSIEEDSLDNETLDDTAEETDISGNKSHDYDDTDLTDLELDFDDSSEKTTESDDSAVLSDIEADVETDVAEDITDIVLDDIEANEQNDISTDADTPVANEDESVLNDDLENKIEDLSENTSSGENDTASNNEETDLLDELDTSFDAGEDVTDIENLDLSEELSLDSAEIESLNFEDNSDSLDTPPDDVVSQESTDNDVIEDSISKDSDISNEESVDIDSSDLSEEVNIEDLNFDNEETEDKSEKENEEESSETPTDEVISNNENAPEVTDLVDFENIPETTAVDDKKEIDYTVDPFSTDFGGESEISGNAENSISMEDFLTELPAEKAEPKQQNAESELVSFDDIGNLSKKETDNAEVNFDPIEDFSDFETLAANSENSEVDFSVEDDVTQESITDIIEMDSKSVKENSVVISDKSLAVGEIFVDINKDSNSDVPTENEHLEELYNKETTESIALDNQVRVTKETSKSAIPIYAGVGGIALVLLIVGIIFFSVSKYINPVQNTSNQALQGGDIPNNNNNLGNDVPNTSNLNNNNVVMNDTGSANAGNKVKNGAAKQSADNPQTQTAKPIPATAFISVRKLSWEVPDYVSYDSNFKQYFQSAGKSLKAGLSSDLLLATDYTYSDQIRVSILFARDGSFKQAKILLSSGSSQVDNIVLQSVNQTLKVLKAPNSLGNDESTTVILKIYL